MLVGHYSGPEVYKRAKMNDGETPQPSVDSKQRESTQRRRKREG